MKNLFIPHLNIIYIIVNTMYENMSLLYLQLINVPEKYILLVSN